MAFTPRFEQSVDLTLSIGTDTRAKGVVLVVEDVGAYLIPQHILDKAKANEHYPDFSDEKRQQYLLHLMLLFVEESSFN